MSQQSKDPYRDAGVDTEQGDALVDWLNSNKEPTNYKLGNVVSGIGGFAALFKPAFQNLKEPLIVTSTDGVGTKLLLAIEEKSLDGIGQDLVAMCVNDLYTVGARPMFFLDYYATGKLDDQQFKVVLSSIRDACAASSMPLLGGETAEMPGLYGKGHFDLAGFVVGAVDAEKRLGPERVQCGDVLYAVPSSGFHSNGYSLVRKLLAAAPQYRSVELIKKLLAPTRLYHWLIDVSEQTSSVHALANITGGGISGNLPRVIPDEMHCRIEAKNIRTPEWMRTWLLQCGHNHLDLEAVFNLGVGMIAVVAKDKEEEFLSACSKRGEDVYPIGNVEKGSGPAKVAYS